MLVCSTMTFLTCTSDIWRVPQILGYPQLSSTWAWDFPWNRSSIYWATPMAKPPDDVGWKARAFCGSHRSVLPKRFLTVIGDSLIGFKNILQDKPVEKDWNESILLQVVFFFLFPSISSVIPTKPWGFRGCMAWTKWNCGSTPGERNVQCPVQFLCWAPMGKSWCTAFMIYIDIEDRANNIK